MDRTMLELNGVSSTVLLERRFKNSKQFVLSTCGILYTS